VISRADVAEAEELMSPRVDPVAEGEDRSSGSRSASLVPAYGDGDAAARPAVVVVVLPPHVLSVTVISRGICYHSRRGVVVLVIEGRVEVAAAGITAVRECGAIGHHPPRRLLLPCICDGVRAFECTTFP
jgi:hypothetical protein